MRHAKAAYSGSHGAGVSLMVSRASPAHMPRAAESTQDWSPVPRSHPGPIKSLQPSMLLDCGRNLGCLVMRLGNGRDHFGISSQAVMTTETQRRK